MSENFLDIQQLDLFQCSGVDFSENLVTWKDIYNKKRSELQIEINVVKLHPPSYDPYGDIGYITRKKRCE